MTPGSSADKAGVQVGDVILSFGGRDIATSADLPPLVGSTKPAPDPISCSIATART